MSPSRLARFLLSSVALHALWLLLSSCLVSASPQRLSPTLSPPGQWYTINEVAYSTYPGATASLQYSASGDGDTLSITASGYTALDHPASWTMTVDGMTYTYTATSESPVSLSIAPNHVYNIVLKAGSDATGIAIMSIMASGTASPSQAATTSAAAVPAPSSTTHLQEPPLTSSPTGISTNSLSGAVAITTTIISGGSSTVLVLTSPTSSLTSTPASLLTMGDPYFYAPSGSVSLTNPSPSFNASNANLAESSSQPKYSAIVGAVLGSLAAIAVCFFGAFMFYRRRQRKRIPPSMAYMNYRSTTDQPPQYHFHKDRTPFKDASIRNNRAGIGAGGGLLTVTGRGRALSPLDEKSAEGSINTHSPSPYLGMPANDNATTGSAAAAGDRYPSLDSSIDAGIARTISPPSSAEPNAQTFQLAPTITRSERNSNAYDGMEEGHMPNPFEDPLSPSTARREGDYGFGRAV